MCVCTFPSLSQDLLRSSAANAGAGGGPRGRPGAARDDHASRVAISSGKSHFFTTARSFSFISLRWQDPEKPTLSHLNPPLQVQENPEFLVSNGLPVHFDSTLPNQPSRL